MHKDVSSRAIGKVVLSSFFSRFSSWESPQYPNYLGHEESEESSFTCEINTSGDEEISKISTISSSRPQTIPAIRLSIPHTQTYIPRTWINKFRKKRFGEPIGWTKGWEAKVETSGLDPKDKERLRRMYDIPSLAHIMIPNPCVLNNAPHLVRWIAFHEKALWLGARFPLYLFIRKFL